MTDPTWLTNLEATARAATPSPWKAITLRGGEYNEINEVVVCHDPSDDIEDANLQFSLFEDPTLATCKHVVANSPAQVLALCKLVRELGEALRKPSLDRLHSAGQHYLLGPVTDEVKS